MFRCPYSEWCQFETLRKDNLKRHLKNIHNIAIQEHHKESLIKVVSEGVSADKLSSASLIDLNGPTPLYSCSVFIVAASVGNLTILEAVLNARIDIQSTAKDGSTALHCASRARQSAAVQYLLDNGASIHCTNSKSRFPLEEAILGRCPDTVKILLARGIPKAASLPTIESRIARSGSLEIVLLYIDHLGEAFKARNDQNMLAVACTYGQTAMVAALLRHADVDINKRDTTGYAPIHQAVKNGHIDIFRLLLAFKGFDLHLTTKRSLLTPLCFAIRRGYTDIAELILKETVININLPTHTYGE